MEVSYAEKEYRISIFDRLQDAEHEGGPGKFSSEAGSPQENRILIIL
jgi:hypothetical protein